MNKQKIKDFVQEHKTEIIVGVVCGCIGVHYGKKRFGVSADEMKLVRSLRTFYPMKGNQGNQGNHVIKNIYEVQKGSTRARVFQPAVKKNMSDINEAVKDFIEYFGENPETTGFVVFTK